MRRARGNSVILVVEDNLGDVDLLKTLFSMEKVPCELAFVSDGIEALSYLERSGNYVNAAVPDVVLVDLNLPRKDGRELLCDIKANDSLKHIPVIIFTTSNNQTDVYDLYRLGAAGYITKPADIEKLAKVISAIKDFWLTTVELPSPAVASAF